MRALCLDHGKVQLREVPTPIAAEGEALVRVQMAGVCNTDVEIAKGYMGFSGVLGHELYGVVEAASDAGWVGKRVAGEINLACGRCETCAAPMPRHCPARSVMGILGKDGCFAEYVSLPLGNLHPLPSELPDEVACFIEPTAAAFEVIEQGLVGGDGRVIVLGDGKLGQLIAQVLQSAGHRPLLVGKHERKLSLCRARGIATAALSELSPKSFDTVIEATGSAAGMKAAIELTRPRGTLVLKSTYHGVLELDAAPLVIDELSLVGSRCGPFAPAIDALRRGAVDPRPLIDETFPLARGLEALERAQAPGVMKVLLDMRVG